MYTSHSQSPASLPATPDDWAGGRLPPRGAPLPRPLPPPLLPRSGWPREGAARGGMIMV